MILALLTSRMCSLFEEGGTMFSFGEACEKCNKKSVLRVQDPLFYWQVLFSRKKVNTFSKSVMHLCVDPVWLAVSQVATEADLGLADAYINGCFSFVNKREGLLNLFLVILYILVHYFLGKAISIVLFINRFSDLTHQAFLLQILIASRDAHRSSCRNSSRRYQVLCSSLNPFRLFDQNEVAYVVWDYQFDKNIALFSGVGEHPCFLLPALHLLNIFCVTSQGRTL